jgi:hypothetical protein
VKLQDPDDTPSPQPGARPGAGFQPESAGPGALPGLRGAGGRGAHSLPDPQPPSPTQACGPTWKSPSFPSGKSGAPLAIHCRETTPSGARFPFPSRAGDPPPHPHPYRHVSLAPTRPLHFWVMETFVTQRFPRKHFR